MTTTAPSPLPPWGIIANYPVWPSPYFAHLERHWPAGLPLAFRPGLDDPAGPPGAINLHRLKRLYRDPRTGTATMPAAEAFLARLAALKDAGWRLAWTVHGLLPVDGPPPGPADHAATAGVLELADAVLCHTRADARALEGRTRARTWVTSWSCLDPPAGPPAPEVADLAARMPGGRILLHPRRVDPAQAGHLYAAAHAAVCPYRTDGRYAFLGDVFYPGSVGTATGFAVPVIAPTFPAVEEITAGQLRWLARPGAPAGLGGALAAAEDGLLELAADGDPRDGRPAGISTDRWRQATAAYRQAARWLARQPGGTPLGEDDLSA